MKKRLLILAMILAAVLLIGPFLIPVPELEGTVPPQELAQEDSQFIEINDLNIHYKSSGDGDPLLILLHGFGASQFSWHRVVPALSETGTVIAYDRPAFGLTERPLEWEDDRNPYTPEAQVEMLFGMMDAFDASQAILIGNSAGGRIAAEAALAHPERIKALVLVDAAVYSGGGTPPIIRPLLKTPQLRHIGPLFARRIQSSNAFLESAWHDPSKITRATIDGYRYPLQAQNWDRALWELTIASSASELEAQLDEFELPILVITGDDDRIVPTDQSIRLAAELPNAELHVLENCGHLPQEECPEAFLDAVLPFIENLP